MWWDEWGGGMEIADIAVIARHRRNRKGRILPLKNTDDTDQEGSVVGQFEIPL
jgi:hypothetical protein